MQRKFSTVFKAVYGLYLKPCIVWVLVFKVYDQMLSWPSLQPNFLLYTSQQLKMHYGMTPFQPTNHVFLSLQPMLILFPCAFKSTDLLPMLHWALTSERFTYSRPVLLLHPTYSLHLLWNKNLEKTFQKRCRFCIF